MDKSVSVSAQPRLSGDQPFVDTTQYGPGPDDSINDATENAAVTQQRITLNGITISYAASAGHLVAYDQDTALPYAKIFYISFTKNDVAASSRPVTFFYNGGPGSSSVYLLLGSFGPRRIKTSMPEFTPPSPYTLEDNDDSLLDHTDLVFINPVGTGYSAAIAPWKNINFWGVDKDAQSIKQFIKRYLTVYGRWNSPKFLFGESYGTPRTCVLTWLLHEDGIDLNGIILQSSILDWSQRSNPVGLLPTFAADALYWDKVTLSPPPPRTDVDGFMNQVEEFARGQFAEAIANFPNVDQDTVQKLSQIIGIPKEILEQWNLNPAIEGNTIFLKSLFKDKVLGQYDGRVTSNDTGIAGSVDPNFGGNDPTITAVGGVYTAMWNVYLNEELKYMSTSPFVPLNFLVAEKWDFKHTDPTGAERGGPGTLYTAGDLAASMELNPYLKVFCANGYYDAVTPFFQTKMDLENMPIGDKKSLKNLVFHNYESGHMIYLDNLSKSRSKMKEHLGVFYDQIPAHIAAVTAELASRTEGQINPSRYRRRFNRTPY